MTTTSKKATGNQSKSEVAIGDGWDDAPKATSESEHPAWLPQLASFKEEVIAAKLTQQPEGSTVQPVLIGTLVIAQAFGEPRYFVDTQEGKRIALPLHGVLTSALDHYRMSPAPLVRLAFMGEANRAKAGQRAAYVYDVRAKPADALLAKERADPLPLLPIHRENKAKRDAQNAKGKANGGAIDEAAPDIE